MAAGCPAPTLDVDVYVYRISCMFDSFNVIWEHFLWLIKFVLEYVVHGCTIS